MVRNPADRVNGEGENEPLAGQPWLMPERMRRKMPVAPLIQISARLST